jgi:ribosomal-protein-alanine N-acetyltransferase
MSVSAFAFHAPLNTLRLDCARLELIACSGALSLLAQAPAAELAQALGCPIAPDWLDRDARFLIGYYADWALADPSQLGWGLWFLREKAQHIIIGSAGFKGKPDWHGMVELGYGIAPGYQGRGYATEAAARLIDWAFLQPQVTMVTAECLFDNFASRRVLVKLGMTRTGREGDYDRWLLKR